MAVHFVLNGEPIEVDEVDPHTTLLQWLRASGRTGTKEGCSEGECGACAVALLKRDPRGKSRFEPVNSCLVPLPSVGGQSVVTVEGVAGPNGELHHVQKAMVESGGSQCGYCTPGFIVSLFCEYYRPARQGYDPESISGNLCRCTGYRPIADVARSLPTPKASDPRLKTLAADVPALPAFQHSGAGRRFLRPTELEQVFDYLAESPEAMLIAGGTDLMVYANQRHERWQTLISLEAIAELRRVELGPDKIVLGAGTPLAELEERLAQKPDAAVPLLAQLLPLFSSRLIRNRATLGGNLATASPIGDSLPVLLALDAEVTLASAKGRRKLLLADFFVGYRKTALLHGELIVSVELRRPLPVLQRFYKASKRVLDDISTVAAAFALDLGEDRRVQKIRIAYGGIAATPLRAYDAERAALGEAWTSTTLRRVLDALATVGTPQTDHRGTAAYRRAMVGRLFEKFFRETSQPAEPAS
jgi:xanthine dehydrogenase small subunit